MMGIDKVSGLKAYQTAQKGDVVISTAGRDAARIYAVIAVLSDGYVLVANGANKSFFEPKLKKMKHLRFLGQIDMEKLESIEKVEAELDKYSSNEYAKLRQNYYKPKKG